MIYLVLGMHKSGTTLVARTLHESGIYMGQDFPAGLDYRHAKFEAKWVQEINDSILGVGRGVLSSTITSRLLPAADINDDDYKDIQVGIDRMGAAHTDWGFKDPREALTYQYWKKLLPPHKLVVIYRNPLEVWKRYFRPRFFWRLNQPFFAWRDYNRQILQFIDGMPADDCIVIDFERFLSSDDEMARLRKFTGRELVDVINRDQPKNRIGSDGRLTPGLALLSSTLAKSTMEMYRELEARRAENVRLSRHA